MFVPLNMVELVGIEPFQWIENIQLADSTMFSKGMKGTKSNSAVQIGTSKAISTAVHKPLQRMFRAYMFSRADGSCGSPTNPRHSSKSQRDSLAPGEPGIRSFTPGRYDADFLARLRPVCTEAREQRRLVRSG